MQFPTNPGRLKSLGTKNGLTLKAKPLSLLPTAPRRRRMQISSTCRGPVDFSHRGVRRNSNKPSRLYATEFDWCPWKSIREYLANLRRRFSTYGLVNVAPADFAGVAELSERSLWKLARVLLQDAPVLDNLRASRLSLVRSAKTRKKK